jgi:hypothetical protein
MDVISWAYKCEHEQVSTIQFFKEYSTHVDVNI